MRYSWKITPSELQEYTKSRKALVEQWRRAKMHCNLMVDCREMLEGIRKNEEEMFEEELKDLEIAYKHRLCLIDREMEDLIPDLVEEMKMFVNLYETREEVEGKLSMLKSKRGDSNGSDA